MVQISVWTGISLKNKCKVIEGMTKMPEELRFLENLLQSLSTELRRLTGHWWTAALREICEYVSYAENAEISIEMRRWG
jgi:coenzyme F420-reducing hydrogenase delta subunit